MGRAGMTAAEGQAVVEAKTEKELQNHCINWLRLHCHCYLQIPFGKKTGIRAGYPDITVFLPGGKVLLVEAKSPAGGELSEEQESFHAEYWAATGETVRVVRSLDEFRKLLTKESPND